MVRTSRLRFDAFRENPKGLEIFGVCIILMIADFEAKLERYAELTARAWLNVQPGQRVWVTAPIETAPLVRLFCKYAYQVGSPLVYVNWIDEKSMRVRYEFAPRDSAEEHPAWLFQGMETAFQRGDALLSISAQDPDLLRGLDADFVARVQKTVAKAATPMRELGMSNAMPWLVLAMPIPSWAARVYPNDAEDVRMEKLWNAVFEMCRMNEPDPLAAWAEHLDRLEARCDYLNGKQYDALYYFGGETDLTVGLPKEHVWVGGRETSKRGIPFISNVPTEEVFTAPHRERVEGRVTSTIPCDIRGVIVSKFTLTFRGGRVVKVKASNAQDVLENYIATDEGAGRLGELALVPHSSPISKMKTVFYNGLIDENAASHLAIGRAYPQNVRDGLRLDAAGLEARGLNDSLTHLDFMVGSGELNLDGIMSSGAREPIMRNGEWAYIPSQ